MIETVVVDINSLSIYNVVSAKTTPEQVLENAIKDNKRDIQRCEENYINYPSDLYKSHLKKAKNAEYKIMAYGEFLKLERDYYINLPIDEITEERFDEQLNVLPPLRWCRVRGVEMFCMREMLTRTYTEQYARVGGKFYCKIVDVTDKSTWIHNFLDKIKLIGG